MDSRKPIQTLHKFDTQLTSLYQSIRRQINLGRQVYIVFPLIKESEKSDLKNLEEGYIKEKQGRNTVYKVSKKHSYDPHYLIVPEGKIGFGRNGLQNEELTFKRASKEDTFLHVKMEFEAKTGVELAKDERHVRYVKGAPLARH